MVAARLLSIYSAAPARPMRRPTIYDAMDKPRLEAARNNVIHNGGSKAAGAGSAAPGRAGPADWRDRPVDDRAPPPPAGHNTNSDNRAALHFQFSEFRLEPLGPCQLRTCLEIAEHSICGVKRL